MNTFTFTDDEALIVRKSVKRYLDDINQHLKEADRLSINDSLVRSIMETVPITEDCLNKINLTIEK